MANPYTNTVTDLDLSINSESDEGWLYLIAKLGESLDSNPTTGNPYRDLLNRLTAVGGECFAVKRLRFMLNSHVAKIDTGLVR